MIIETDNVCFRRIVQERGIWLQTCMSTGATWQREGASSFLHYALEHF
jgi:hypothetical protein